jgi:hypothetical protein
MNCDRAVLSTEWLPESAALSNGRHIKRLAPGSTRLPPLVGVFFNDVVEGFDGVKAH